jgi:hypothetical protein
MNQIIPNFGDVTKTPNVSALNFPASTKFQNNVSLNLHEKGLFVLVKLYLRPRIETGTGMQHQIRKILWMDLNISCKRPVRFLFEIFIFAIFCKGSDKRKH